MTLEQARAAIIADVGAATETEMLSLNLAHGRFLAEDVCARLDHPVFDNSAMDGYAVDAADLHAHDLTLSVVGESRCGDCPQPLVPHSTTRIFTGAPVPTGANAVVIQEEVKLVGPKAVFPTDVESGQNIRYRGEDFHAGDMLYRAGRRLSAYDLALISTAGVAEISTFQRPRALVIATGDELVTPGTPLKPGQVYESNRLATLLQLQELGVVADDGGIVEDDPQVLKRVLKDSADYDFVITSGGASVGDHDLVKQVFSQIGEINFWKVNIKPGKPIAFGRMGSRTHFFALPGNPVSSLVTFKLFVEPALIAWHHAVPVWVELEAIAANGSDRAPGRTEFLRASLFTEHGRLFARALAGQGSHMMGALRETNGFIKVDAGSAGFGQGDRIVVIPLSLDWS